MEPFLDPTRHPSEDQLEFYALGRLAEPELEHLEVHLLACASCQDSLLEIDAYLPALRAALAESQPTDDTPRNLWWNPGWLPSTPVLAGALAAILLAAVMLRTPGDLSPASVTLRSERGGAVDLAAQAPSGAPLDLHIQSSHLTVGPDYRVAIVDSAGQYAWAGGFDADVAHVPGGLSAGTYWVRLFDGQQRLLQEYGLQLN